MPGCGPEASQTGGVCGQMITMGHLAMTIVRTSSGDIQGYAQDGIHYFKKVPFAAPPVGGLRFVAPQTSTRRSV
jgi:hypothetical protein